MKYLYFATKYQLLYELVLNHFLIIFSDLCLDKHRHFKNVFMFVALLVI